MDYRKEICKLLKKIQNEKYLRFMYKLALTFLEEN